MHRSTLTRVVACICLADASTIALNNQPPREIHISFPQTWGRTRIRGPRSSLCARARAAAARRTFGRRPARASSSTALGRRERRQVSVIHARRGAAGFARRSLGGSAPDAGSCAAHAVRQQARARLRDGAYVLLMYVQLSRRGLDGADGRTGAMGAAQGRGRPGARDRTVTAAAAAAGSIGDARP